MTKSTQLELSLLASLLVFGLAFPSCSLAAAPAGGAAHKKTASKGVPAKPAAKTGTAQKPAVSANKGKPSSAKTSTAPPKTTASPPKAAATPSKPVWTDVTNGFKYAKQVRKWILADVYTDWCGWCKRLDHDTFEDPTVEKWLASGFVCIKVNAEDGGAGEQLAKQYGVNGFPTIMIFEPGGKLKGTLEGYLKPGEFMQKVNQKITGQ